MQKLFTVELVLIMLIVFVKIGESIKCYKCRSDNDTRCNGKLETSMLITCPEKEGVPSAYCRKINQQLKFRNEQNWTTIRECAYEKAAADCYHFKWLNLGYQTVCECEGEECNGTSSHIPNIALVTVLFLLLGIFKYLNCDNT